MKPETLTINAKAENYIFKALILLVALFAMVLLLFFIGKFITPVDNSFWTDVMANYILIGSLKISLITLLLLVSLEIANNWNIDISSTQKAAYSFIIPLTAQILAILADFLQLFILGNLNPQNQMLLGVFDMRYSYLWSDFVFITVFLFLIVRDRQIRIKVFLMIALLSVGLTSLFFSIIPLLEKENDAIMKIF